MKYRLYVTFALLVGMACYTLFPIEEPRVSYFVGVCLGVLLPFWSSNTFNKWVHSLLVTVVLSVLVLATMPYFFTAGIVVGYCTHVAMDVLKRQNVWILYPFSKGMVHLPRSIKYPLTDSWSLVLLYVVISGFGVIALLDKFSSFSH